MKSTALTVKRLDSRKALVPSPVLVEHTLQINGEEGVGRGTIVGVAHLLELLCFTENSLWSDEYTHAVSCYLCRFDQRIA